MFSSPFVGFAALPCLSRTGKRKPDVPPADPELGVSVVDEFQSAALDATGDLLLLRAVTYTVLDLTWLWCDFCYPFGDFCYHLSVRAKESQVASSSSHARGWRYSYGPVQPPSLRQLTACRGELDFHLLNARHDLNPAREQ
ncbi:hypothetical protein VFPBJ_05756 [Purpureocillium lilacinum]|uniref:Uncharacterized protein n=1 Tax=Purpureocillium lilacinum TaxID=33203 RepID=A0A179GSB0_PURLI|nr:hypothetical protein VFPBJ_05756 [Purpureocillium lilacinum]